MVDEHLAFEMVALVLDDAGQESRDFFLVGFEILVDPAQQDMFDAGYLLRDAGQTQAALAA